jgi:hypothetical protein
MASINGQAAGVSRAAAGATEQRWPGGVTGGADGAPTAGAAAWGTQGASSCTYWVLTGVLRGNQAEGRAHRARTATATAKSRVPATSIVQLPRLGQPPRRLGLWRAGRSAAAAAAPAPLRGARRTPSPVVGVRRQGSVQELGACAGAGRPSLAPPRGAAAARHAHGAAARPPGRRRPRRALERVCQRRRLRRRRRRAARRRRRRHDHARCAVAGLGARGRRLQPGSAGGRGRGALGLLVAHLQGGPAVAAAPGCGSREAHTLCLLHLPVQPERRLDPGAAGARGGGRH